MDNLMESHDFFALLNDVQFNVMEARAALKDEAEGAFRNHVNIALDRLYVLKRQVDDM